MREELASVRFLSSERSGRHSNIQISPILLHNAFKSWLGRDPQVFGSALAKVGGNKKHQFFHYFASLPQPFWMIF